MWCSALLILPLNESTVHLLLKTLPMADGTSFCCVELVRLTCPLPVVFCRILKATFDFSVWCSVQQLSILSPRDDEVNHMPVSGTRMHPGGIAFIFLLDRCSSLSVRTQSTEPV